MSSFNNKIGALGDIALSAPKWYALTTIVDVEKILTDDGVIDLTGAKVSFEKGDKFVIVPYEKKTPELDDEDLGKIYTVKEVVGLNRYKTEESFTGEGKAFLVKFTPNQDLKVDQPIAYVPITVEMIQADHPQLENSLYRKGIRQSGWYKWRAVTKDGKTKVVNNELLVAMNLHTPPESIADVEPFEVLPDGDFGVQFDEGDEGNSIQLS